MNDKYNVIVDAKKINKRFVGVHALADVDISIREGEIKCLVGENGCGKSTFVKIISGVYKPTDGEIYINGKKYDRVTVREAIDEGIQVIYQDLSLFDHLTVAENIAMNKLIKSRRKVVSKKEADEIAKQTLAMIGVKLDLDKRITELSIANKQIVAICRALSLDAKILFMDEPTTALTKTEVDNLLKIMTGLKEKGMTIVFISHKLDEIMQIADSITIMRDGQKVGDFSVDELNPKLISKHMTGRDIDFPKYKRDSKLDSKDIFELKDYSKKNNFQNINMKIRKGDIVGLTGLLGAGRTELALSIFGLNKKDSGEMYFEGKKVNIDNPAMAIDYGISLLPEDRSTQGLFMDRSVKDNILSVIIDRKLRKIKNNKKRKTEEDKIADSFIEKFKIRTYKPETIIKTLSGGNQQKAVLSKWIAPDPKLLILDSPTVGVDVGSKTEIYEQIQQLAREGLAIILLSDEAEEIAANCNKVIVMYESEISAEFTEEDMQQGDIQERINIAIEVGLKREEEVARDE